MSWEYKPQTLSYEKRYFKQFYYTFKSQRDGKNYRLHYNARNGKFVKYKEIKEHGGKPPKPEYVISMEHGSYTVVD